MSNDIFRVGLVGAGCIAHTHAETFGMIPDAEVAAVAEIIDSRREDFAQKYNIKTAVKDYRKLFEMKELDAVVLCLPNYLHAPVAVEALKAGKHVLSEKPMGMNGEHAAEMVKTQRETGKTLMVTVQGRYTSRVQFAKKYASENLGEIYYGRCAYMRRSGIPGWGSWFTRKKESGGGPCADIGVHVLDQCLFLMGYPRPVSVAASTYSKFGPQGKGKGDWGYPEPDGYFDVEDLASAFIRFENGATVIMEASWAMHWPNRRYVEVLGTQGGIIYDNGLKIFTDQMDVPMDLNPELGRDNGSLNMSRHFIDCCRTGKKPDTAPEYGLIVNRIFDAVYESAALGGKQVEIPAELL
jgi:predicted dehydrogenase